jgi:hypothetical protein
MSKIALIFLLSLISGLIGALFYSPVYGFYLYELVYFLNPSIRWWSASLPDISYSFFIVLIMLFMFIFKQKDFVHNTVDKSPQIKWYSCLFLTYCVVYFFAVSVEYHQRYLIDLLKLYVIMFIAFRMLDSEHKLKLAILVYLVGSAYIGYEAFSVGRNSSDRVEGIGMVDVPEANGTAAALTPAIPFLLYFFWQSKWKMKVLMAVLGLFIANGLVLLNSRGSFLGAIAGFGYYISMMLFSKYKLPKQKLMLVLIVVGSLIVALRLVDDSFLERMKTIQTSSVEDTGSGASRVQYWLATFDMLEDWPMGMGVYGYQILSPSYLDPSLLGAEHRQKKIRAVHSMWFQGLGEVGWLGFTFYLLIIISIFSHLRRAKKWVLKLNKIETYYFLLAVEASLIAYMVAGSFINVIRAEIFYWSMLFCICASVIALNYQKTTKIKLTSKNCDEK